MASGRIFAYISNVGGCTLCVTALQGKKRGEKSFRVKSKGSPRELDRLGEPRFDGGSFLAEE